MKLARHHIYLSLVFLLAGLAAIVGRSPQITARLMAQLVPASAKQSQHYKLAPKSVVDGTTLVVLDGQAEKEVRLLHSNSMVGHSIRYQSVSI